MTDRLLLLDLDPAVPSPGPRVAPFVILPLSGHRVAIPLNEHGAEEVLAALLAEGMAIRSSRVIEQARR